MKLHLEIFWKYSGYIFHCVHNVSWQLLWTRIAERITGLPVPVLNLKLKQFTCLKT